MAKRPNARSTAEHAARVAAQARNPAAKRSRTGGRTTRAGNTEEPRITRRKDWRAQIIAQVRDLIRQAAPDAVEEFKWRKPSNAMAGVPVWSLSGILCTAETYTDQVKLTFARGASLPDPTGMFNAGLGGGTRRAIDIREGEPLNAPALTALIRAAVMRNQSPASAGRSAGRSTLRPESRWARRSAPIADEILAYNASLPDVSGRTCNALARILHRRLPQAKSRIWHRHPVWFLDGNPIVGYSKLKDCVRLLFWSGQSFDEPGLSPEGSFKAAEARFTRVDEIPERDLDRWLRKSIAIQWDYKNIVKRKGRLDRLK